jgi:hypothetical protein
LHFIFYLSMLVHGWLPIFTADWHTKFNRYANTANYTMSEKTAKLKLSP